MPKTFVAGCDEYDHEKVRAALEKCLSATGGMSNYVKPGDRVLLKPNLLRPSSPSAMVTTHPEFVRAVIALVQEAGGRPMIGDSPGDVFTPFRLKSLYRKTGMRALAKETGVELNFDTSFKDVSCPQGRMTKTFPISNYYFNADVVIALPKPKTHSLTAYTGAAKVLFGAVPGLYKPGLHGRFPKKDDFASMLVDLAQLIPPNLVLMDGIFGMDGQGPGAGKPKYMGFVLSSENVHEADVVASHMMGFSPEEVPMLREAIDRGLVSGRLEDAISGSFEYQVRPLKGVKRAVNKSPFEGRPFLSSLFKTFLSDKPAVRRKDCVGCGICARVCPAKAISLPSGKALISGGACIRCFCCHEICPENAIYIKHPLFR